MADDTLAFGPVPPVRRHRRWLAVLGVTTLLVCGAGAVAVNAMAYRDVREEPQGEAPVPPITPPTTAVQPTSSPSVPTTAVEHIVPDVGGQRLTEAKAALAAAGFGTPKLVDATGQGRVVLAAENWVVVRQEPAGGTAQPNWVVVTLHVRRPTDGQGSAVVTAGVIPDVVCKDLQAAQDALRGARFFNLRSEDATGLGRMQVFDRDWVVVAQSERPDTSPPLTTRIVLDVVKFGESTGDSGCPS